MRQTTEYELPLWDADDRILRQDFNAANEAVDAALTELKSSALQLHVGTYEGDGGVDCRTVTIGYSPKLLLIFLNDGLNSPIAVAAPQRDAYISSYAACSVVENGFRVQTVGNDSTLDLNRSGRTYFYVAFA